MDLCCPCLSAGPPILAVSASKGVSFLNAPLYLPVLAASFAVLLEVAGTRLQGAQGHVALHGVVALRHE